MENAPDDVSNIHNRFSLTLVNPSSHYFSLFVSLGVAAIISAATILEYLETSIEEKWYVIPTVIVVLFLTQLLDTRFTKKKEYSKSLHSSLFANMLWAATVLLGLLASFVLGKETSLFFVTFGMFLFASFRIGIYTTTLGVSLKKAWAICFVQPLAMFAVLIPQDLWFQTLSDPMALFYGVSFMIIASVWSVLTDRAGRPGMESTHKTIQAYLASQKNDHTEAEEIMEGRSSETKVATSQIRLSANEGGKEFRMVLPEIHPGPYHPVGGSNIPYLIYKNLSSSAMVMHSISDHALNLPSKNEVENYLKNLENSKVTEEGLQCTEPVTVQINKARVIGLLFGKNPLLFLSLSPHGMEDIPNYMKNDIEQYAKNRNYSKPLIVDCHNAMGEEISNEDGEDMLKAAKSCLDTLITKDSFPIEFGYANSDDMDVWTEDLGMGGLGIVCLKINEKKYFLGWADANNMENGVREKIIDIFAKKDLQLLEICTSDTHYAPVKARNRNGYYQLGLITSAEKLAKWFLEIAGNAESNTTTAKFEILENETKVKVMGQGIYEDYSKALDNSLKITKGFLIGGVIFFITSLFL
ncbi:putative membrane protein [Marine Group I thaumarchaeote SCGC AAA799-E16]|uniref:Putative membrane protein n=5 Tax=Marine Group I TaxID=905826 RepID=A0A081RNN0_9ARCH|nr:putative membrane protein [Marine Group I thaumarchaeote SCGC AAA799-N04]KER06257.1 putative membrane protein [Marine Group I thaumarchaeote SCGC AAA799-E16]KFM18529.1 putative membrane protein [Marine Group I thaumarchaeote SCGC RSA3]